MNSVQLGTSQVCSPVGVKIRISVEDEAKSKYILQPLLFLGFLFHLIGITPNFKEIAEWIAPFQPLFVQQVKHTHLQL